MATPADCPHHNQAVTTPGPYYRQAHPKFFQNGRALSSAFILQDTSCHLTLSLNDAARTTPERCQQVYTSHPEEVRHFTDTARRIAAILMITARP